MSRTDLRGIERNANKTHGEIAMPRKNINTSSTYVEETLIASGINRVFEHRKNYIVIGLTGRTGSGCTTAAQILSTSFEALRLPSLANPPASQEDRKSRIVKLWAETHWRPFKTVSVTSLILALALEKGAEPMVNLVEPALGDVAAKALLRRLVKYQAKIRKAFKVARTLKGSEYDFKTIVESAEVFTQHINDALEIVRDAMKSNKAAYTELFQTLGNNIRCSGDPFQNNIDPNRIFTIPSTLEFVIRLLRNYFECVNEDQMYVVIDALRHPYEIRYLRERISSFYTVAVSTTDAERRRRLHGMQFTDSQMSRLDETEYPNRIADAKKYVDLVRQNIQACLELADIYISNTGGDDQNHIELTRQLVRYVSLMQHPGLVTPTPIERCMQAALTAKANSGCISRQVGAVVTDESYSIKAMGWNDVPHGQVPCLLRNVAHLAQGNFDSDAYSDYEKNNVEFKETVKKIYIGSHGAESYDGRNLSYCFKSAYNKQTKQTNQVHTRSLHAEENAFLQIAKHGGSAIQGGYLFTTASPCELCAKKAYQLGVKIIFYIDPYPGIASKHVLASGTLRPETRLFDGAIGTAYHDLYQPIMSYKDELPRLLAGADVPSSLQ